MSEETGNERVVKKEDILNHEKSTDCSEEQQKKSAKRKLKQPESSLIKGKPKSGRFWKSEKKKFSSIIKTKGIKLPLERKQALREKLQKAKEASHEIKAKKQEEEELRKQRRRDNLKRQEENRKKSEIVQVITNTKKLKRLKKKQMRNIEKRDTTVVSK